MIQSGVLSVECGVVNDTEWGPVSRVWCGVVNDTEWGPVSRVWCGELYRVGSCQ